MTTKPQPDFTAYIVALSQLTLKAHPRWRNLVPGESAAIFEACARACERQNAVRHFLAILPVRLRLALMDRLTAFGFAQHIGCRKQAVEVQVRVDIRQGATQVVMIGAGFDALCLRLAREFPEVRFFELDVAVTQDFKRAALSAQGVAFPPNLYFLPCDLSQTPLDAVLRAAPEFALDAPTLFIAEGLTMYLTREENMSWLAAIRRLDVAGHARLIITAIETTGGTGKVSGAVRDQVLSAQENRFKWSIPREEMPEFLDANGFRLKQARYYEDLQMGMRTPKEYARLQQQPGEQIYFAAVKSV